jgi:hypothetical protein
MRNLIGAFLLGIAFLSYAQDNDYRVIPSLTDWIQEINNWPDSIYQTSHIRVIIDGEKDSLIILQGDFRKYTAAPTEPPKFTITKRISVQNIVFATNNIRGWPSIENIEFSQNVYLSDASGVSLLFKNIHFKKGLSLNRYGSSSAIDFTHCQFGGDVTLRDISSNIEVTFNYCRFSEELSINNRLDTRPLIRLINSQFAKDIRIQRRCQISQLFVSDIKLEGCLNLENATD